MAKPFNIRKAGVTDLDAVMELENATFPKDHYTREMIEKRLSDYPEGFLVVENDQGQLVAYIAFWLRDEVARIDSMAVADQYRRQGIGADLVRMALEHFSQLGKSYVELEVRPNNDAAIRLYKRFGFKEQGLKKGYYWSDNGDALAMAVALD